jgi:hypothetical protein
LEEGVSLVQGDAVSVLCPAKTGDQRTFPAVSSAEAEEVYIGTGPFDKADTLLLMLLNVEFYRFYGFIASLCVVQNYQTSSHGYSWGKDQLFHCKFLLSDEIRTP